MKPYVTNRNNHDSDYSSYNELDNWLFSYFGSFIKEYCKK